MSRFPYVLSGIFVLVGAAIAGYGLFAIARARRSASWPDVPGVITKSRVSSGDQSHAPDVAYAYTVDGVAYEGDAIAPAFPVASSTDDYARRRIALYPVGARVSVYHDPDAPATAVLEPGASKGTFVPLVFGLMFATFGGFLGLLWWLCEE